MTRTSAKNKVALSDYHYQKDIEIRAFLRNFTPSEIAVFQQIQLSSLQFSLDQIKEENRPSLKILEEMDLLHVIDSHVYVNKEMRKNLEIDAAKLEEDFTPNFTYLQHLLARLPQNILPLWYPLPKSSHNIFKALIEQHFNTPKLYRKYLESLEFEDAIQEKIYSIVHEREEVAVHDLGIELNCPLEKLHEHILQLEYQFTLILSYKIIDDKVIEILTPPIEWIKWKQFIKSSLPASIPEEKVKRLYADDFGALHDINQGLQGKITFDDHPQFLAYVKNLKLESDSMIKKWLEMPIEDQSVALYRQMTQMNSDTSIWQVEKALKKVTRLGWIFLDDFLKSLTIAIGSAEPVTLKMGRNCCYRLPNYTSNDYALVTQTLKKLFFHTGFIAFGTCDGKECFKVTDFGRLEIE